MAALVQYAVAAVACITLGMVGSVAGMCAIFDWPLSPGNFADAISLGIKTGTIGTMSIGLLVWVMPFKSKWQIAGFSIFATGVAAFAVGWWMTVTSLG